MSANRIFRDSSRDVWSHGSGRQLRDLLSSALSTLLMIGRGAARLLLKPVDVRLCALRQLFPRIRGAFP